MTGQRLAYARLRRVAGCAILVILTGCTTSQSTNEQNELKLNQADGFESLYKYTYYHDICDDAEFGAQIRQLIKEKFKRCAFTNEARLQFDHQIKIDDATAIKELEEFYTNPIPGEEGKRAICDALSKVWGHTNLQFKLQRYHRGLIGIDEVVPFKCDVKPIHFGDDEVDCRC